MPASGVLTASITGLPASPSLGYGDPPLEFNVTLTNGTSSTYQNIGVVVSVGHCGCTSPVTGAEMAPVGTMQEQDPATGQWSSVPYIREGTGMDYLGGTLGSITLSPGATQSYALRIAFNPLAQQGANWTAGQTSIDVTVVALPSHRQIGQSPAATVQLAVTTS
jgi:hypothetical protein